MPLVSRLLFALLSVQTVFAQPTNELLTRAIDVLSLPADQALRGINVSVQGVVTAAQPDWEGRFFVQDDTAGVFVENISDQQPVPGDLVAVTGISHPGGFAPIITRPHWEKLGMAPLPTAKAVPIEELMAGIEDSQRVEISGTVRTVRVDEYALVFHLVSGGYRVQAIVPPAAVPNPQMLVGATVRVRGTAAASFNPQLRQLITMSLYVPVADDFIVEKMERGDPFDRAPIPIGKLAQYRRDQLPSERVLVKGTVIYQRPGEDLFLHDGTGGLHVKSQLLLPITRGTMVEAIGFSDFEDFLPVLQDAVFRQADGRSNPVAPISVTLQELQNDYHHADLITLEGKVLDHTVRRTDMAVEGSHREQVTLTIQTPEFVFLAEGPATESNAELAEVPLGSTVELTGICMLHIAENGQMESLQLLLPSTSSMRILRRPSWLTPKRLLTGLALLSMVLILAVSWTVTVSRKNAALKILVRDKATAKDELQQAHDMLEGRVEERTAQLKVEMTARKEAKVRFKATLAERTRLAQELHDTTEQSLTGISLQLDTAAKLFERDSDDASRHLQVARHLMTQSQLELRRSIWDLRSRELEQFDLPNALRVSADEIREGTHVKVDLSTTGEAHRLSEVVEQNLLRIGREALTNVIKHAHASQVNICLAFGPKTVTLQVKDDGRGFSPANAPGSKEGHFGLLGISERAKRFNGHLRLTSTPGNGTCLEVEIPIREADETDPTATTADAHGLT